MQDANMKRAYIAPDIILRLLIGRNRADIMQLLKRGDIEIITHPFALYEAFACLDEIDRDEIDLSAFAHLLNHITVTTDESIGFTSKMYHMTKERKEKLRRLALDPN